MDNINLPTFVISIVLVFLILVVVIFIFFIIFDRKKSKYLKEKEKVKQEYEKALFDSRNEIQEQILKNISWELHDNLGQMLSACKMQLSALGKQANLNSEKALEDSILILNDAIVDIRQLSRTLNNDYINLNGIVKSTELEVERFNRLNYISASISVNGEEKEIDEKDRVILFRIIQEVLSNVIKHSKATILKISFQYLEDNLLISIKDNGVGMKHNNNNNGIGMTNLKSRVNMLKGTINFIDNNGLEVVIRYPYKNFTELK